MSEQASSVTEPARRLVVRSALRTDVGLVRSENQDFGTCTSQDEESASHPGGRLLIVADGMGGHRGGATASRLAGETVKAQYLESETTDIAAALRDSLTRANARIFAEAQANPDLRGMGTTTSVLALRDDRGWLAHVGDSRIYLIRGGTIQQLTDDHSLVATMVREGLLTTQEAETHPRRNVLQRSMGVAEDVEVDVRGPIDLEEGDTFILCSDGLHGLVKAPEMLEIAQMPVDEAADEFIRRALERGAPDNVTVIVARVESVGERSEEGADHFEETQPLEPVDLSPFDSTQTDAEAPITEPMPAAAPADGVAEMQTSYAALDPVDAPPAAPEALDETQPLAVGDSMATAPTVETPAPRPRGSLLKWALVAVLVLGAAGAWFYWNQQQPVVTSPAHSH